MFCSKKIIARGSSDEDKELDFSWLFYVAMNKLGFSYRETGHLHFGLWVDLFESHKAMHNFETKRGLYDTSASEPVASLDAI